MLTLFVSACMSQLDIRRPYYYDDVIYIISTSMLNAANFDLVG